MKQLKGLVELVKEHISLAKEPKVLIPEIFEEHPKSYEEMGEIIFLDLDKVVFYGRQDFVNGYKLDAIVEGIKSGDDFPPVFVSETTNGSYTIELVTDLLDETNYGGHHRALGHKKTHRPLKCVKLNEARIPLAITARVCLIKNIESLRTREDYDLYLNWKKFDKKYR